MSTTVRQFKMLAAAMAVTLMAAGTWAQQPDNVIWNVDNSGYLKYGGNWYAFAGPNGPDENNYTDPAADNAFHSNFVNAGGQVSFTAQPCPSGPPMPGAPLCVSGWAGAGFNFNPNGTPRDISGWAGVYVTYYLETYFYSSNTGIKIHLVTGVNGGASTGYDYLEPYQEMAGMSCPMMGDCDRSPQRRFFPFSQFNQSNAEVPLEDALKSAVGLQFAKIAGYSYNYSNYPLTVQKIEYLPVTAPAIISADLPNSGEVGMRYTSGNGMGDEIKAEGANIVWSVVDGTLPPGIELVNAYNQYDSYEEKFYSTVHVEGNPITPGSYKFKIKAANGAGAVTQEFTINITAQQPPVFTATTLPDGEVGRHYGNGYAVVIGTGSGITPSVTSGALPKGLELSYNEWDNTVYIYGTPEQAGTFPFTVKLENDVGSPTRQFSIYIPNPPKPVIEITAEHPQLSVEAGQGYYSSIIAKSPNVKWSISPSTSWLELHESSYNSIGCAYPGMVEPGGKDEDVCYNSVQISGEPTQAGNYTFTVTAENDGGIDTKQFTITVTPQRPPVITTTELNNGGKAEKGSYYSNEFRSEGYTVTSWRIVPKAGEQLPPGLEFSDNGYSAYISGQPSQAGTYTFTVEASNAAGTGTKQFTIVVIELLPPVIAETPLPPGGLDSDYEGYIYASVKYSDGSAPRWGDVYWNVTDLPDGFNYENYWYGGEDGLYTLRIYSYDHPTEIGEFPITVTATNDAGSSGPKIFTLDIKEFQPPVIITATLESGVTGVYYSNTIRARGSNLQWTVTGLPDWIEESENNGLSEYRISGTPNAAGSYPFTVKVEDDRSEDNEKTFTIVIKNPPPPVINSNYITDGELDQEYFGNDIYASGSNITWSVVSGELPPGLRLDPDFNGGSYTRIIGTPTVAGEYTFTVEADNGWGVDTKEFTIMIQGPRVPAITAHPASGSAATGETYPLSVTASANGALSYQWYSNTSASNIGGTLISGATAASYTAPTGAAGTTAYYYAVVTNTLNSKTAAATSNAAAVSFKALPSVTVWPASTAITYGVELSKSALTGGTASVQGTFAWTDGTVKPTVTNSGYSVTFTPTDNDYIPITGTVQITVNKATLSPSDYTVPTGLTAVQGAALSSVTLPAGWSWESPTALVGDVGTRTHTAKFTPTDAANYNVVTGVDVTITVRAPTVTYTITFDANGGTVSPASGTTGTDGQLAPLPPTPTRTGYTFNGWYTAATGGDSVTSGKVYSANATIYAHWTLLTTYTITFDANGGTVSPSSGTVTAYGGTTGKLYSLPEPEREGYTFNGWFTEKTGGDKLVASVEFDGDAEIYAQWTLITYTITFNANGGTVTTTSGTTGAGWKLASLPTPTRAGYVFNGWFTAATGGVRVTTSTVFNGNDTVYAAWRLKPVPVITIGNGDGGANPLIGDTLTASLTNGGDDYSYAWKLGGVSVGSANQPYAIAEKDIGGRITLVVTESGETYTVRTAAVIKGAKPDKPSKAPTVERVTYSAVKLAETGGYEYAIEADGGAKKWQESSLFNGLTPNTEYTFYQRVAETKTAYASLESLGQDQKTASRPEKSGLDKLLVKARNRPEVPRVEEASVAPSSVSKLTGEFTAGPNPVVKYSGPVNFYRRGGQLTNSELRVYDVNGNVVSKVKISDLAIDNSQKRTVGSWDLKDANGRQVSSGTYLVKGVLKTVDGKVEKVSLILGVR